MQLFKSSGGWFASWWAGRALSAQPGKQSSRPGASMLPDAPGMQPDQALQLSAVWGCVWLLANVISTLPLFIYQEKGSGRRDLARDSILWSLLHDSPNRHMTPVEFWCAMLLNLLLRGNAYARIDRNAAGEAIAITPMPADQVEADMLSDGALIYTYRIGSDVLVLAAENVLHIKDIGNGIVGLSRLDYMRCTTSEASNAQGAANKTFASRGKPTGVLMLDGKLNDEQRKTLLSRFAEMAEGNTARLYLLEAQMKYQQISISAADMQLLETRRFTVEEIGRWFGVPAVLINHSNVTTWGSGIEQIVEGFFKLTVRPALVRIEQAITRRVLTPEQRARYTVEFSFEGLLRASAKERAELYGKLVQNGLKTRNECRQLENDPPISGGDELTVQTNLAPLDMLRTLAMKGPRNAAPQNPAL